MVLDEKKWKKDTRSLGDQFRNTGKEVHGGGKRGAKIGYDPNK